VSTAPAGLEEALRTLPAHGTLVKDRGYRQVWRFEHGGQAYYLKFYPKEGPRDRFRRFFRGSPAMAEFTRLQMLQRGDVPAPRAVAVMLGFTLQGRKGDIVIIRAIEPSVQLDQLLNELELKGEDVPNHHQLVQKVCELVARLGKAKLGHEDLHLGNFLLKDGEFFLLDGYAVKPGGLKMRDLFMLANSVSRYASTSDVMHGWEMLGPGGPPPNKNPITAFLRQRFMQSITRNNRYFGRLNSEGWSGVFYRQTKYPHRWSQLSQLKITDEDWQREWPVLWAKMQADQLPILKRSPSGDVLEATLNLAGKNVDVIIKRPKKKYWYRYVNEIGRGSRAMRAWRKSWNLLSRGFSVAWPIMVMEKRTLGYVTDAIFICEKVPGLTLERQPLEQLETKERESLMFRAGRILRLIEQQGHSHFDAKASNWIIYRDDKRGAMPIMIDVDGVRYRRWVGLGIDRLLRAMQGNPSYTPEDSLWLCRGYAPRSREARATSEQNASTTESRA